MTPQEMEQAIEFLLSQNARFNEALDRVREVVERLTEVHVKAADEIQELRATQGKGANDFQLLTGKVLDLTDNVSRLEAQGEAERQEMRDAINNLIIANEVTRKLSEDVARLTLQTSQRVTALESKQDES